MTGQAGKVARGLRTIGANISQLAQGSKELEIQVNGATKSVQLWNEAGTDMLDTYQVLQQISVYWKDMTNAEKASLAIDLAKKTQMDTFLAVMGNFGDAEKAYVTALKSEGSALKENAAYMESIEAHQAKLKAEWENLVLSQPFEDLEKTLLNLATLLLKFANSDLGQTIVQLLAVQAATMIAVKAFLALKTAVAGSHLAAFISMMVEVATTEGLATAATTGLTIALEACPLFWGAAVATGVFLIVKALKSMTVYIEEQIEVLSEYNDAVKKTTDECDSLKQKIQDTQEAIEKLNEKRLELTDPEDIKNLQSEKEELKEQEALLKSQLALKEAQLQADKNRAQQQADVTRKTQVEYVTTNTNPDSYNFGGEERKSGKLHEALDAEITNTARYRAELSALEQEMSKYTQAEIEAGGKAKETADKLEEVKGKYLDAQDVMNQHASMLLEIKEAYGKLNPEEDAVMEKWERYVGISDEVENSNDKIRESVNGIMEVYGELDEIPDAFSSFVETAQGMQSAYETLNKAAEEYNKNGSISAATLKKLAKLNPQYANQLQLINGQMEVSNGLLQQDFNTQKELAIIRINTTKWLKIQAACQEVVNKYTKEAGTAAEESKPQITELSNAYNKLYIEARKAGDGVQYARNKIKGVEGAEDELDAKIAAIEEWATSEADAINAIELGAVESSKSAAGASKDAWVEAFEEEQRLLKHSLEMNEITEYEYYQKLIDLNEKYFGEISGKHQKYIKEYQENEEEIYKGLKSVYDKVASYLKEAIEQGYEDAINALKKEEKRVLDEIKAQIEALKDEKKKVLQDITDQINSLKKKKDKVQDYWNSQIDKIKESNEQLQKQNELLEKQQALQRAKAQKVMVMKGGKFQLSENESVVAQAEQNLAQYEDQLSYEQQIEEMEKIRDAQVKTIEDRIENLEEYKDYMEDYYDSQIEALEEYRDQVEREYEAQIDALQEQLDTFKRGAEQQKKIEEARLAARVLGINQEADLFQISLENAQKYVDAYNTIMESLGHGGKGTSVDVEFTKATASGIPTDFNFESIKAHSSGTAFVDANEVALVGESPNTELVLGSNVNRSLGGGTLMNLRQGSGVVNAESTATLAGLLNGITRPNQVANHNKSMQQNFTFGNITLPNVTDADSFVNTLSTKFNTYSIQYGNNRR